MDGDRWAQFDFGGRRIALAGSDKTADVPGLKIKVKDVARARDLAVKQGLTASKLETGAHETYCKIAGPGGWPIVFYSPLKR